MIPFPNYAIIIPTWLILRDVKVPVVVMMAVLLKLNILGSIFNGKIILENSEPRTATLSPLVSLIVGEPSVYKAHKTKQPSESSESCSRGG